MKNHVLNKLPVFALAAVMAIGGPSLSAFAEADPGSGADTLLNEFQGTYTALFPAFRDDRYDTMWEKSLSEYAGVDAENAETVKDAFLSVYESDIHGEEAQKKAEEEPGWFMFDCSFAGGVDSMTFDGNTISGIDKDGNEVFNNMYEYFDSLKKDFDPMTEMYMAGVSEEDWPLLHIFVSDGPDDEFKYFAFADDTPAETYHLEFRYGSDPEDLCRYFTGPYGYWMVSATYKDCGDEMMENCIDLFVQENADSIKAIAESFSGSDEEDVFAGGSETEEEPADAESIEAEEASSDDGTVKAAELLEDIKGTYEPLFPIITDSQYDQLWLDPCISVVGEEAAPEVAEMLKSACSGTVYGQEAIDDFGDGSEGAQFDCLFINGPSTITFDGNVISGNDENGDKLFSHEYKFVGGLSLAGLMDGYLYETEDEDAGEFRYFYMMPDTPATTYHLEFRYGSDVDALTQYNEGPYAYWLAAGFPVDADEEMVKNVITLFCEENLAEMAGEEQETAA